MIYKHDGDKVTMGFISDNMDIVYTITVDYNVNFQNCVFCHGIK